MGATAKGPITPPLRIADPEPAPTSSKNTSSTGMGFVYRLSQYGLTVEGVPVSGQSERSVCDALDTPQVLSTSAVTTRFTHAHLINGSNGASTRKGFLDHLKPRAALTNTMRVAMQQGTLIMANFMSEQLETDLKRNQRVEEGELTLAEAEEQAEQWEKEEWEKRWKVFPSKFTTAFAKYHVITLLMRAYEHVAAMHFDTDAMNRLTLDPFQAARQLSNKGSNNTTGALSSTSSASSSSSVASEMFATTFWANLIAFMADYSVHQVIVCYGYYSYIRRKQEQRKSEGEKDESMLSIVDGPLLTSWLRKSTQLFFSRCFGLGFSAVGGAFGTLWWPGWGTLLFSNMGEGAATVIMDDGQQPQIDQ